MGSQANTAMSLGIKQAEVGETQCLAGKVDELPTRGIRHLGIGVRQEKIDGQFAMQLALRRHCLKLH